jgi:hypothetical protein
MGRSRRIVGISVVLALVLAIPTVALAGRGTGGGSSRAHRFYQGKTSQNAPAFMGTVKNDGNWGIFDLEFGFKMRCDDGTKFRLEAGFGFGTPVWLDSRNRFAIDENYGDAAFHVRGRLGPNAGSGTVEFKLAELTQDEQSQLCTSKERTWTVQRLATPVPVPVPVPVPAGSPPQRTVHVTVGANGRTHVIRSW